MKSGILFEACVESPESAVAAEKGGAGRIELCVNLDIGGLTPPAGMIRETCEALSIPVNVLIRPRGGDFNYSSEEFETMKREIEVSKQAGANGVVVGILNADNSVDLARMRLLVEIARPMSFTFHRAFDESAAPFTALDDIMSLGIERLLTSGQEPAAEQGIPLLKQLVEKGNGRVTIMPGGGVSESNAGKIIDGTGAREIHASLRASSDDYESRVRRFVNLLRNTD